MKLLDLFCGGGGAAMGYHLAGIEVVGVDNRPMKHYPFEFVRSDAMTINLEAWISYRKIDAIHASPPCQKFSRMSGCEVGLAQEYEDLITPLRADLQATGLPYIIENVTSPFTPLINTTMLCGRMFGLKLYRHRLFETNFPLPHIDHPAHDIPASKAGHWTPDTIMSVAGHVAPISEARAAMGIDWLPRDQLVDAVPPAYTEWIGKTLREVV